jgi:hypothetical protein
MPLRPARLLCVCSAVIARAGYDSKSATVAEAEVLLRTEEFDLIIVSALLGREERNRVTLAAGETPVLVGGNDVPSGTIG